MSQTLPELLGPYNRSEVARKVGRSRQTVASWASGTTVPEAEVLPALAELLRVDLGELTRIVARQAVA